MEGPVRIEIDPGAGFCFGVEKAIRRAEESLASGLLVYGLGDMVHNDEELKRLRNAGLKTISHDELPRIKEGKVILRAHGEPPSTFRAAEENGVEIIDATCPIVTKLQQRIRKQYQSMDPGKEQIVIYGKKDHPETIGLLGQTNNEAILVTETGDISAVDPDKITFLYSQTTMDPEMYSQIEIQIAKLVNKTVQPKLVSNCTICNQMKRRKPGLKNFALGCDLIIFVAGKTSSNGKMLFEYSRQWNERTYLIQNPGEIDPEWLAGVKRIGISGATSTSLYQLEKVRDHLRSMI